MARQDSVPEAVKTKLVPILVNRESKMQIPTARDRKSGSINPSSIIFLEPGFNLVKQELWDAAKENSMVKMLLTKKIPSAVSPEDNPEKAGHYFIEAKEPVDADNPLAAMSEDDALEFVDETLSVPLLKSLQEGASTAAVQRAIRAQIDKIESPKKQARAAREKADE